MKVSDKGELQNYLNDDGGDEAVSHRLHESRAASLDCRQSSNRHHQHQERYCARPIELRHDVVLDDVDGFEQSHVWLD